MLAHFATQRRYVNPPDGICVAMDDLALRDVLSKHFGKYYGVEREQQLGVPEDFVTGDEPNWDDHAALALPRRNPLSGMDQGFKLSHPCEDPGCQLPFARPQGLQVRSNDAFAWAHLSDQPVRASKAV